ncbi:MAG: histidine phosphatase family protein [Acidimicrobiia bacterium]
MPEIVLIRHAESAANVSRSWQGRGDAEVSVEGRTQIKALTGRLARRRFDAVVSSPLSRAVETAAGLADAPDVDEDLIEIDLGVWEDVSIEDVLRDHGALLRSIYGGGDDRFGLSGERLSEVATRAWTAIDQIAEQVGPAGSAAIVTHGGVIDAVLATLLPSVTRRPHRMVSNTALSHLVGVPGRWRLARFNDSAHLGKMSPYAREHLDSGGRLLALIRHGRTRANVEGRAQGQSCWGLDEVGHAQAGRMVDWYGRLDTVFTSPLSRAVSTAAAIAAGAPVTVDGLKEIAMGEWEGLDFAEIRLRWPDETRAIFDEGQDLPRGISGETWQGVTDRAVATIGGLDFPGSQVSGVVTHGGLIRAYVGTLGGGTAAATLHTPDNTSVTHIALTDHGPVLCDYAVAPHLEEMAVAP